MHIKEIKPKLCEECFGEMTGRGKYHPGGTTNITTVTDARRKRKMGIKILDVYSQNRFDFEAEKANGVSGVIFKGGQGEWPDVPRVHPEWFAQCEQAGLLWGIYWLVDARYSPEKHKAAILKTFPNGFGKLGLWLDCEKPVISMSESDYRKLPYAFWKPIESIARGVIRDFGVQPGIYTSWGAWDLIFGGCPPEMQDWFAQAPLWTAQYKVTKPVLYGAWKTWTYWQYQENPDYSLFSGTDDEFWEMAGGTPVPVENPPDIGTTRFMRSIANGVKMEIVEIPIDDVTFKVTPSVTNFLQPMTVREQVERYGWDGAINGDGFVYSGTQVRVFGRAMGDGVQYCDNTLEQSLYINRDGSITDKPIDPVQIISYPNRLLRDGQIPAGLDNQYKACWTAFGLKSHMAYFIVADGVENAAGMTKQQLAEWGRGFGLSQMYLFDSGHSSALVYGGYQFAPYGDEVANCLGFKVKPQGAYMTKGIAKAGTKTNVKLMTTGDVVAFLQGGDYVYGELSSAKTDLVNFDHFYRSGGRVDLPGKCKAVVLNMTLSEEAEPGVTPNPDPNPSPVPQASLHLEFDVLADGRVLASANGREAKEL